MVAGYVGRVQVLPFKGGKANKPGYRQLNCYGWRDIQGVMSKSEPQTVSHKIEDGRMMPKTSR